eukprot:6197462-Pleurochrysis_carterae.AAC.2
MDSGQCRNPTHYVNLSQSACYFATVPHVMFLSFSRNRLVMFHSSACDSPSHKAVCGHQLRFLTVFKYVYSHTSSARCNPWIVLTLFNRSLTAEANIH